MLSWRSALRSGHQRRSCPNHHPAPLAASCPASPAGRSGPQRRAATSAQGPWEDSDVGESLAFSLNTPAEAAASPAGGAATDVVATTSSSTSSTSTSSSSGEAAGAEPHRFAQFVGAAGEFMIPLMPLTRVKVPTELITLQLFEPRYRLMFKLVAQQKCR